MARPMSEINRKLVWLISIRVLVVVSIAVPYILSDPHRVGEPTLQFCVAFASVQTLFFITLLRLLRQRPQVHAWLQILSDLALVTLLIFRLNAAENFSTLFIIVIAVGSTFLSRTGVLIIAGLSYGLYLSLVFQWLPLLWNLRAPIEPLPQDPQEAFLLIYNLIMHLVGFYGVAILTSYLARDAERSAAKLRKTHHDLSSLQSLYSDVIQSMSSGLVIIDLEGTVVSINPTGEEILGRSQGELIGRPVSETGIFTRESWPRHAAEHQRVRSETTCRRGDGEEIVVGFTLTQLADGQGYRRGFTLIFQDMTDWRKLQEQVRMQDRMAAIGQMAAGLAHEVGNPLAAISGSVEMLAHRVAANAEHQKLLDIMLRESHRLDRTVKAFLQFAKPQDRQPEHFDIAGLMNENVSLLRNSDDVSDGHEIVADLESAIVCADRDQIGQVFWNLARNALQAMPGTGRLEISGRVLGEDYQVTFHDTGRGMGDDERDKLFQPFKSFFDSGIGLGMAIVYRIVEEHGGHIEVDSEPGRGTRITVLLPREPAIEEAG